MLLPTAFTSEQVEVSTTALSRHVRLQAWEKAPNDQDVRLADLRLTAPQARDLAAALTRAADDTDLDVPRGGTVRKHVDQLEVGDQAMLEDGVRTVESVNSGVPGYDDLYKVYLDDRMFTAFPDDQVTVVE
jgi:hypothetical protein